MSESMFSSSWYRVSGVKPRLRNHAQIHRHVYRGEVWFVMQNHSTGRFHRFSPVANMVIGLMNGRRTLQEIWELVCARLGDDAPTQGEIIKLLSDLHRADVLLSDAPPDTQEIHQRRTKQKSITWKQYLGNPLSLRFPLFDPEKLLQRIAPYFTPLFGWWGAALWILVVVSALILVGMNWTELAGNMYDQVFSTDNLLLLMVVFPLVKLLHELGHALVAKAGGGEVHEMGVMMLVLMPIPYVDASSASAFRDKKWRILVGSAGMIVEMFVAAIAVFFWVNLEPGFERAIAYNVILVSGVSTLVFNGNPLLRFDAYYILSDYLEIPNLAQRSNEYLGFLTNHYLYGVEKAKSPVSATGERTWFMFYAIGSFVYRMFIMVSIILMVAGKFFLIGTLLALWAFFTMFLKPLGMKAAYLVSSPVLETKRQRAFFSTAAILGFFSILLMWLPAPSITMSEGVIWAPEQSQVRALVDAYITDIVAEPNQPVRKGDLLIRSNDPGMEAKVAFLKAQLDELQARYSSMESTSRVQATILVEQIAHVDAALRYAIGQSAQMNITSPADGTFVMQDVRNLPGRFVQRGEILAYVTDDYSTTVRVAVPQDEGAGVKMDTQSVEIRPVDQIGKLISAKIKNMVPAATFELPSDTLSLQGGGEIGLDPTVPGQKKSLQKLFVFDLELPYGEQRSFLGKRVYVRFEHSPEPLLFQWYRDLQRKFMRKLNA